MREEGKQRRIFGGSECDRNGLRRCDLWVYVIKQVLGQSFTQPKSGVGVPYIASRPERLGKEVCALLMSLSLLTFLTFFKFCFRPILESRVRRKLVLLRQLFQ